MSADSGLGAGGVAAPGSAPGELELSIVIPCLNEAETLGTCVRKALGFLQAHGISGEVIVAENGSTDASAEIAARLGARVVHVARRGYGSALMGGIEAARGRFVIMGDADDSYDFSRLTPFLDALREGNDLVIGNRFRGGIKLGAMPRLHRYLGNPLLSGIGRLFFHSRVGDFHCGLRGFRRGLIEELDLRTIGMEFASEMVVKATLHGARITEVATTLSRHGRSRPPHLRTWRDGWRHLRFLLLYSPRWLFLYPGAALMVAGAALVAWLLPGPRRVGNVTLDVHTLLYGAGAIILGFEAVSFAVFTKVFAVVEGLHPPDRRLDRLLGAVSLEAGLVVGCLLIVLGVAGTALALSDWARVAFQALDPTRTLRLVIPAVVALALGFHIVLTSFFLSILRMARR
jgi:hypothetical protein